jgi:hypothetical protein
MEKENKTLGTDRCKNIDTNSMEPGMAYGTRNFKAAFTRVLQ